MKCPRRDESWVGDRFPGEDKFSETDNSCTYCGSLNPDEFMARLEKGDVKLTPTDKGYKVYIENDGGAPFKQTYRTDNLPFEGYDSKNHTWVTRDMTGHKFYFRHLSEQQMRRFIELYNEKKIKLEYPGRFYVRPFFMVPVSAGEVAQ